MCSLSHCSRAREVLQSRDRKEADAGQATKVRETRTLTWHHSVNGRRDVLRFPQKLCTTMVWVCPSLPVWFIKPHPVQTPAGVSFEIIHDPLWRNLGLHHAVHVIASHVLIQVIRSLIHTFPPRLLHAQAPSVAGKGDRVSHRL